MTAKAKLAQKRLTLLQLAEKLGNVSKACQMHKVSRSQRIFPKKVDTFKHKVSAFVFHIQKGIDTPA